VSGITALLRLSLTATRTAADLDGQVDPTNGEVFVVGLMADQLHHVYRVNPRTGAFLFPAVLVSALQALHLNPPPVCARRHHAAPC